MKIPYKPFNPSTTNNTYWKMNGPDVEFILNQCKSVVQLAPYIERFNIKHPKYNKLSTGAHNTAETLCSGILDNFGVSQFDLSEKQCIALVEVFRIGEEEIEDFCQVEFEQVDKLPKLKSINTETQDSGTTLGDLFDIESITVTYRKI